MKLETAQQARLTLDQGTELSAHKTQSPLGLWLGIAHDAILACTQRCPSQTTETFLSPA